MAMGRYTSSSSSQDEPLPANDPPNMPPGEDVALPGTEGSEGMEAHPGKSDTNLDEELRHRLVEGSVLPDPETTASMREHNNVELEYYMAGLQRQLTAHIRWLYVQTVPSGDRSNELWYTSYRSHLMRGRSSSGWSVRPCCMPEEWRRPTVPMWGTRTPL